MWLSHFDALAGTEVNQLVNLTPILDTRACTNPSQGALEQALPINLSTCQLINLSHFVASA